VYTGRIVSDTTSAAVQESRPKVNKAGRATPDAPFLCARVARVAASGGWYGADRPTDLQHLIPLGHTSSRKERGMSKRTTTHHGPSGGGPGSDEHEHRGSELSTRLLAVGLGAGFSACLAAAAGAAAGYAATQDWIGAVGTALLAGGAAFWRVFVALDRATRRRP
jgi:hypothetical protein